MPPRSHRNIPVGYFICLTPMEVRQMRVSLIKFLLPAVILTVVFSFGCKGSTPASLEPVGDLLQINVFNAPAQLNQGQAHALGANGVYSGSAVFNITSYCTWATSNMNVIMITGKGLLLAVGGGSATISCSYRGVTSTGVTISVPGPPNPGSVQEPVTLDAIMVDPVWVQVAIDGTTQFMANAIYSNGSTQDITNLVDWHVSDNTPGFIIDADNAIAWGTNYGLYRATGPIGTAVVSCDYLGVNSNYATVVVKQF